mmetsp:Transcript_28409/g.98171  ORF Transcript_28409/g.98171 Transcript_28409/m.98171 type:complete len:297 (-) Transcript_28409:24-914(-)
MRDTAPSSKGSRAAAEKSARRRTPCGSTRGPRGRCSPRAGAGRRRSEGFDFARLARELVAEREGPRVGPLAVLLRDGGEIELRQRLDGVHDVRPVHLLVLDWIAVEGERPQRGELAEVLDFTEVGYAVGVEVEHGQAGEGLESRADVRDGIERKVDPPQRRDVVHHLGERRRDRRVAFEERYAVVCEADAGAARAPPRPIVRVPRRRGEAALRGDVADVRNVHERVVEHAGLAPRRRRPRGAIVPNAHFDESEPDGRRLRAKGPAERSLLLLICTPMCSLEIHPGVTQIGGPSSRE